MFITFTRKKARKIKKHLKIVKYLSVLKNTYNFLIKIYINIIKFWTDLCKSGSLDDTVLLTTSD